MKNSWQSQATKGRANVNANLNLNPNANLLETYGTSEQARANPNLNVNVNGNGKAAIKRVKNHARMSSVEREQTRYEVSTGTGTTSEEGEGGIRGRC